MDKRGNRKNQGGGKSSELLVIGRNSVTELLDNYPNRVRTVYLQEAFKVSRLPERLATLLSSISVEYLSRSALDALVGSDSHQSVVAQLHERNYLGLESFIESSKSAERGVVLALDSISDPQNFGSILRAAECFGVRGVVWSKNRGCGITPVVTKVSSGASELVPLVPVSNLTNALETLKSAGYWTVCSDLGPDAVDLSAIDLPEKIVLVLGSEGEGVQPLVRKRADFVIKIPMQGKIDSLNVAQAAAVILSQLCKG